MVDKLPHNYRIFTARLFAKSEKAIFWAFLIGIFIVNSMAIHPRLSYSTNLFAVFSKPLTWETHVHLAQALWQVKNKNEAMQELAIAQEFFPPDATAQVLGVSTTPLDLLTTWENEPEKTQKEIRFWQQVTSQRPDYRDAYIQLAYLAYETGNTDEAQTYVVKARALDPNGEMVQKLEKFLSKK